MGNFYSTPERKGNSPFTRSGLPPPPLAKKDGKDLPSHRFSEPMNLELHLKDSRARTSGMTPAEREWRIKYLKDQHLHPDEPIHVDAVHRQLNPARVLYRWPWDKLYQHFLRPTFGVYYGTAIRVAAPKIIMGIIALQWTYYLWKYETRDWTKLRGIEASKRYVLTEAKEIEQEAPGLIARADIDPGKYQYFSPSFDKRTAIVNVGQTSRPW